MNKQHSDRIENISQFHNLFDDLPVPVTLTESRTGRFVYMNRAAADLLGMDCNCLSEKTALDFYETASKRSGILGHLSRENSVQVRRLELLLNGVLMNVSAALKLINMEDQEFVFTLMTGTSPASREKEAVMAGSLLSSSEDLVVVTDPGGCILYVNPAFEHITGFSSEELIGKNPSLWKSNLFGQDFYAGMYHQLKDEGVFRSEFMNLKKNGEAYFEDKTIVCVRDHEGRLLYYLSTGRDITGRKREEKRLAMQFAITSIFSSAPSSDAAVYGVLEELRQHGEWDLAEFWKMESSRIRLDVARSDGSEEAEEFVERSRKLSISPGQGLVGRVLKSGLPEWVKHLEPKEIPLPLSQHSIFVSAAAAPVTIDRGKSGIIVLFSRHEKNPDEVQLSMIADMGLQLSHFLERKKAEEKLIHMAQHDSLTNLPNRTLILDRIEQGILHSQRSGRPLAVMYIDLDRFKMVNDTLGHQTGDAVLVEAARRLVSSVRKEDTISRQGGDEFLLLLNEITRPGDTLNIARKILHSFTKPFHISQRKLKITPSVGIAIYPEDGRSAEELVKNADAALYRAKSEGRNRYQFFSRALGAELNRKIQLEGELSEAIHSGMKGFHLEYQPVIDTSDGSLYEVEALARWTHDTLGEISPREFIPLAEETGMIHILGRHVIAEALHQGHLWNTDRIGPHVSVNISPGQFHRSDFVEEIATLSRTSLLPPENIFLEITESTAMKFVEETMSKLRRLKEIGFRLSIDDFGTGYSSMKYLQEFNFDVLKIDRSFVSKLGRTHGAKAILKALVELSHILGMEIVTEGIETEEQLEFMKSLGCHLFQGFLFSRPIPAEQILLN